MEVTVIHGQAHQGSTYYAASLLREKLTGVIAVHEFFLPKDGPDFCLGCFQCIRKGGEFCPHAAKVQNILAAMLRSEVIMLDSPTYCMEMSGQLKALFDHLAYLWMSHRPREEMFFRIGVVVSTAAGAGAKKVTKSMANQLFWWGVPVVYRLPFHVGAMSWDDVAQSAKEKMEQETEAAARRIGGRLARIRPGLKTRLYFQIMRAVQSSNRWNLAGRSYWEKKGWLGRTRPWKR